MDRKDFSEMKVAMPEYGNAPAELVEKHMELSKELAALHDAGEELSSPKMLELAGRINELNRQIAAYHATKEQ